MSGFRVGGHIAHVNNVHYVCAANDHQEPAPGAHHPSPLTLHEDMWAWCSAGLPTGHSWRSIYPTTLMEVTRLMRPSA